MCTHDSKRSDFHARSYEADLTKGADDIKLILEDEDVEAHYVEGNHDDRIKRFLAENARLVGQVLLPEDVIPKQWKYHCGGFTLGGIVFKHNEVAGISGRPIGGDHVAHSILKKNMCSTIVGHSHIFDMCKRTNGKGKKITCIVAGCFLDEAQSERYAKDTQKLWENGVLMLYNVHEGEFDFEWISYKRLKELYE